MRYKILKCHICGAICGMTAQKSYTCHTCHKSRKLRKDTIVIYETNDHKAFVYGMQKIKEQRANVEGVFGTVRTNYINMKERVV